MSARRVGGTPSWTAHCGRSERQGRNPAVGCRYGRLVPTAVDLLVVGAGPAGTAAAITARGHGLDVVTVDKATFPRDKTCGDGLTTAALTHLERLGVDVPRLGMDPVRSVV